MKDSPGSIGNTGVVRGRGDEDEGRRIGQTGQNVGKRVLARAVEKLEVVDGDHDAPGGGHAAASGDRPNERLLSARRRSVAVRGVTCSPARGEPPPRVGARANGRCGRQMGQSSSSDECPNGLRDRSVRHARPGGVWSRGDHEVTPGGAPSRELHDKAGLSRSGLADHVRGREHVRGVATAVVEPAEGVAAVQKRQDGAAGVERVVDQRRGRGAWLDGLRPMCPLEFQGRVVRGNRAGRGDDAFARQRGRAPKRHAAFATESLRVDLNGPARGTDGRVALKR